MTVTYLTYPRFVRILSNIYICPKCGLGVINIGIAAADTAHQNFPGMVRSGRLADAIDSRSVESMGAEVLRFLGWCENCHEEMYVTYKMHFDGFEDALHDITLTVPMHELQSRVIHSIGYDLAESELYVVFQRSKDVVYIYKTPFRAGKTPVQQLGNHFIALLNSDSPGKYYSKHIKGVFMMVEKGRINRG